MSLFSFHRPLVFLSDLVLQKKQKNLEEIKSRETKQGYLFSSTTEENIRSCIQQSLDEIIRIAGVTSEDTSFRKWLYETDTGPGFRYYWLLRELERFCRGEITADQLVESEEMTRTWREIHEQIRSTGTWARGKSTEYWNYPRTAYDTPLGRAFHRLTGKVADMFYSVKDTAKDTVDTAKEKMEESKDYIKDKYYEGKEYVKEKVEDIKKEGYREGYPDTYRPAHYTNSGVDLPKAIAVFERSIEAAMRNLLDSVAGTCEPGPKSARNYNYEYKGEERK